MKKTTNIQTQQSEVEETAPQLPAPEYLHGEEIISWTIKAHPHIIFPLDIAFGLFGVIVGIFYLYGQFHDSEGVRESVTGGCIFVSLLLLYFYIGARKKTVFNYLITEDGGRVEYWVDYSKYTGHVFKGTAIFSFVAVLTMIALEPSFIWMLAGPGAMAIAASTKLMSFENPVDHHTTKWSRYDLVFIDRKRKMIVPSYQHDPLAGFEIHVEKRKIDEVIALLKTLMPNAEFREAEWKW